jgi:magnesium transporter
MGTEIVNFIYLSEVIGLPLINVSDNREIGRIADLSAATGQVYPKITGMIVEVKGGKETAYIPWNKARKIVPQRNITIDYSTQTSNGNSKASENEILLKKTFLDKQIISTSGYKVVRVNDLHLLVDNSTKENPNLWLVHIDIGVKGLLRRLGWLGFFNPAFKWIVSRDMKDKFVSWKYVQPTTTTDVYGSLHLKIDSSKLSEIHPADLADIVEDLGTDERVSLIESLDYGTAAATLQELPLRIRVQLAETLSTEKLGQIINEMQMDEAVDLLDEISSEQRTAVYTVLSQDKVVEIKELSKLSAYSVGSIMNTDFITAKISQSVKDVLEIVRSECDKAELLYYIYVLDKEEHLKGVLTLRQLLSSKHDTIVSDIMIENVISVKIDTSIKRVAQIFFKYNFEAIPVIDDDNKVQGIVTLRDTLESVFPEVKEESKG